MRWLYVVLMSAFLWPASPLRAQQGFIPPMPRSVETLRFSLMTVSAGDRLYSRMGHSMLHVIDPENQLDYLVNWGMFDFSDPWFVPKFFRGILIYRMGIGGTQGIVRFYRDVERRGIVEDDISLTVGQKRALMEKIIWNAQPANIRYPYQYYRNNCATMPRDYLDLAVHGSIRKNLADVVVSNTYRDYVRRQMAVNTFVSWGLDVIFNSDSDRALSKWEEMFYPPKLREYLAGLPSFTDAGEPDNRQPLLTNHRIVVDLPEPNDPAIEGYHLTWILTGVPLLSIIISWIIRRRAGSRDPENWYFRVFGLVSIWWGATSGFFGLTHFSGWVFSTHTDLHRNVNMLLFWPWDMLVIIPGIQMGLLGKKWNFTGWLKIGFWRNLAILHIVFVPIYLSLAALGFFNQDVSRVALYMAPLSLLYYGVMVALSRVPSSGE